MPILKPSALAFLRVDWLFGKSYFNSDLLSIVPER